jgi:broad specificity phosphatase PhoE
MKNVYCIRHGTAEHNVMFHEIGEEAYMKVTDSNLTDKGREESALLGDHWTEKENIDIVFVSPLKRTIQTAINIFKGTNVKMYAFDDLKEYPASYENINHREDKKDLIIKYHKHINFRFLSDKDSLWHDTRHETMEELEKRVIKMKDYLLNRKEKNIAIVSHNSYLSYFLHGKIADEIHELRHCFPYRLSLKTNTSHKPKE